MKILLKDIVTKTRIDTLKAVLPEEVKLILRGKDGKEFNATKELGVGSIGKGFNNCRDEVIKKAKEL